MTNIELAKKLVGKLLLTSTTVLEPEGAGWLTAPRIRSAVGILLYSIDPSMSNGPVGCNDDDDISYLLTLLPSSSIHPSILLLPFHKTS